MRAAAVGSALGSVAACLLVYDEYEPTPMPAPSVNGVDAAVAPPSSTVDGGSRNADGPRHQPDAGARPDSPAVAADAGVARCVACDAAAVPPGTVACPDAGGCAPGTCDAGSCAPGTACARDTDCTSRACQDGRCCGARLGDCTRCAERLSLSVDCEAPPLGLGLTDVSNCRAFLACLAEQHELCPTRGAPGCSGDDPAAVCSEEDFGGRTGAGVVRATRVLQSAGCQL